MKNLSAYVQHSKCNKAMKTSVEKKIIKTIVIALVTFSSDYLLFK